MNKTFQPKLGETVFYMENNEICSGTVIASRRVENLNENELTPFGRTRTEYVVVGDDVYSNCSADDLFPSEQALIEYLSKD